MIRIFYLIFFVLIVSCSNKELENHYYTYNNYSTNDYIAVFIDGGKPYHKGYVWVLEKYYEGTFKENEQRTFILYKSIETNSTNGLETLMSFKFYKSTNIEVY